MPPPAPGAAGGGRAPACEVIDAAAVAFVEACFEVRGAATATAEAAADCAVLRGGGACAGDQGGEGC